MKLGCIGDDFTGSSDLANTLSKEGMRTVQYVGVPRTPARADVDAGVISLKSRSIAPADAVARSLEALAWLQEQGCTQFVFKICSTFDSTPDGNIGPVAEALADALEADRVVVCPAFPGTGRAVYQGHLFVGDALLNESGMQNHPLTPMNDPDLRRWLARQSAGSVGHVAALDVFDGPDEIRRALTREHEAGHRLIVVDALRDADLRAIGVAARGLRLLVGGSGIAIGLPANFSLEAEVADTWQGAPGPCAVLCGSCSVATRAQLEAHAPTGSVMPVEVDAVLDGRLTPDDLATRLLNAGGVPVACSSADPEVVRAAQARHGAAVVATALDDLFAATARRLIARGVTRLIVAGGETSGAVVEGLALDHLQIGPEIDPGIPALRTRDGVALALKSGNFGSVDFFAKAAAALAGPD